MIKKARIIISAIFLSVLLLSSSPAQAVDPAPPATSRLTILDSSIDASFPALINFKIKASGAASINDIRLHYTINRESFAGITSEVYIDFVPATTVNSQWIWDMRQTGGLPTGAGLKYWWTVKDVSGNKIESSPASISFDDNRYVWKSLTESKVTLHWYNGDLSFARQLMTSAQDALARLVQDTGAYLKSPVNIYIYASTQDLQGAMIFPQEWTGGSNFPEFGIITIGIDTNNLEWGKGALAHEFTHQVIHQMTRNPYIGLPTWLDEGLAMYNEGALDASFEGTLKLALTENSLISVRSLASPFSANTNTALLSYAQSYSIIEFLVRTYGQSKMLELLTVFSEGSAYDNALQQVYGFDMDGLNRLWRAYAIKQYQQTPAKTASLLPAFIREANKTAAAFSSDSRVFSLSRTGG